MLDGGDGIVVDGGDGIVVDGGDGIAIGVGDGEGGSVLLDIEVIGIFFPDDVIFGLIKVGTFVDITLVLRIGSSFGPATS